MICVDLMVLGQGYCDIATLSELATTTGGTVYSYTPYNPLTDFDQVVNDLSWNVARQQGLEAVMRVRCSTGLDVESYSGHCFRCGGAWKTGRWHGWRCRRPLLCSAALREGARVQIADATGQ
jgi:hypothetical protein